MFAHCQYPDTNPDTDRYLHREDIPRIFTRERYGHEYSASPAEDQELRLQIFRENQQQAATIKRLRQELAAVTKHLHPEPQTPGQPPSNETPTPRTDSERPEQKATA